MASGLASSLLLPGNWFAADGALLDWNLEGMKQVYATASYELLARRMLQMQPRVVITLFDQGSPQWRLSNATRRPPAITATEREVWRNVFELGKEVRRRGSDCGHQFAEVRCWPVHEPGWRREILRTELLETE